MVHSSEFNMSMNKFISFVDNYYIFDDVDRERLRKTIEYVKAILK